MAESAPSTSRAQHLQIRTDVRGFQALIHARIVLRGDGVLYCWGRQTPLSWAIGRVQRRALADLADGGLPAAQEAESPVSAGATPADPSSRAQHYTHAGMVVDAELSVEMTAPRARLIAWSRRLRVGDRLLIVRPRLALEGRMRYAAQGMISMARAGVRYPWRELLTYWFRALPGAIAAPHFAEHFRDHRRNVCSGAIWEHWWEEGAVEAEGGDAMPESWYPGRMACDTRYVHRVAAVEIVKAGQGDGDEV